MGTAVKAIRRYAVVLVCAAVTFGLPTAIVRGQNTTAAQESQRKTSTPYSGDLSIFDYPDREQKLHIDQVIGAGSGWFTVRAARRVTATGRVYAVEINPEAIRYIKERAEKEKLTNVQTVMGKGDSPELPPDSVDAVLMLKTYHEIAKPVDLLRNLRPALKTGARVGIIDREGNGENHGVQKKVVLREAEQAGYRLVEEHDDWVKADRMDYFVIFVAK
jgi:SAM-dependent methyltransferase